MVDRTTDPAILDYQYGDSEKLRIRLEAHERYSERTGDHFAWLAEQVQLEPDLLVADVGCGPGMGVRAFLDREARVVGVDRSAGMVAEARRAVGKDAGRALVARADAQAIPLADGSCDRVVASHMLYHVPDIRLALREMRRILKPGGRVLLTTGAADHAARLRLMHAEAARELGYTPTLHGGSRFTLDHLELVREVFPTATRIVATNAWVFPSADVALPWYASGAIDALEDRPPDGSHRPRLVAEMRRRIEAIIAREGVFRVQKNAGAFVADV